MIGTAFSLFTGTALGKKLPGWAWEIIAAVIFVGGLWLGVHVWLVHHDNAVRAEQKAADQKQFDAQLKGLSDRAQTLADQANALDLQISRLLRSKSDAQATRIVTQYRDVIVRGPGKANCTAVSGLSTATGGSDKAATQTGVAVASMPSGTGTELIAMPFAGAAAGVRDHDLLLNEAQSWRTWYSTYAAQWAKWNADAAKARAQPR